MDCADYISRLSFSIWQPEVDIAGDRRLLVPRRSRDDAKLVELPNASVDALNAVLPPGNESMRATIGPLLHMARMSTFAVATIINRAVAGMAPGHSYVNVGTWVGFSLLSGMVGNPDKSCVGIDNFSEFGGPRKAFYGRFEKLRSPNHHFHEMDYRDYFSNVHQGPIGVYLYDGDHSYDNQFRGLEVAEPYFGDDCIVLVDDTNWPDPYRATYDFIAASDREYTVLLDRQTSGNTHPTFWNGLLVLRSEARDRSGPAPSGQHERRRRLPKHWDPIPLEPQAPLVSLALCNLGASPARIEEAIEEALAQRWPALEIVFADERPSEESRQVAAEHGERITYITGEQPGDGTAIHAAVDATRGDYVALADVETRLEASAVQIGLAYPRQTGFHAGPAPAVYERLEHTLALTEEVSTVVPPGQRFALANGHIPVPNFRTAREAVAFMDGAEGQEAKDARPADDEAAIERLEGLRSAGSSFVVLGWPSFDWLDLYPRFRDHLESNGRRVLASERAIVFDLRR